MNDPTGRIQQKRLGYLIFDGKEAPIVTERLRDVPLSAWSSNDVDEELTAEAELDRQAGSTIHAAGQ